MERPRISVRIWLASLQEGAQRLQAGLVQPAGRQAGDDPFHDDPRLEQLVQPGFDPVEIQDHRVYHRADARLGNDQAAAGTATSPRDLLILDQADRFTEYRAADAITFE